MASSCPHISSLYIYKLQKRELSDIVTWYSLLLSISSKPYYPSFITKLKSYLYALLKYIFCIILCSTNNCVLLYNYNIFILIIIYYYI